MQDPRSQVESVCRGDPKSNYPPRRQPPDKNYFAKTNMKRSKKTKKQKVKGAKKQRRKADKKRVSSASKFASENSEVLTPKFWVPKQKSPFLTMNSGNHKSN